jgi:glyoxylase-like metal-dependent hydrolase (beta-lactamase superfamily II)
MLFPKNLEPDIVLQGEEERLGERGHLRAILTPGHTPGHLCLYDERNKVLFSGDHVLSEITPHIAPIDLAGQNQLDQYLKSLRKLQRLEVELVLPAHERPFTHLSQRVDELLEHHRQRLEQVLAAVRHHPLSPVEIASRVEWMAGLWEQMDAMNRLLAIQETLAHLRLLQEDGRVTMVERDGLTLYKLGDEG